MRRPPTWRASWRLPAASTFSVSRITARCGVGRAWIGLAGSGRTATRPAQSCAKWSSYGTSRSICRTTAGTSSDGCRRRAMDPRLNGTCRRWRSQSVPALGPYPSRGDYEHCFTLEGPHGEFIQLTPAVARHIARAIETSRVAPRAKKREALEDRTRREEREYDAWAEEVLS
jgi:hypothetical protein